MSGITFEKYRIGEVGKVITGRTPPSSKPECFGEEYPFITPGDMHDRKKANNTDRYLSAEGAKLLKNNLIPSGSVSVSCIGWQMGKSIMVTRPSFTNQQLNTVIPNDKVDPDYLYYSLVTKRDEFFSLGSGVGVRTPILNKSAFSNLEIHLPSLKYQKNIAEVLSAYDNLIENNNRRIAILEEMAQSLYREWFVKFCFPGHESTKFIDSQLGKIPEGWGVKTLSELVNFKRNSVKKGELSEPTAYMGLEHFPRKSLALSDWDEVTEIGSSKLEFKRGDILFGKIRPYFHKVGVAQVDGICSSDTFVLEAIEKKYHALIAMVTFSDEFVAHSVQTSQGTKMPRANWEVLSKYPVLIPHDDLLNVFNGVVDSSIEQLKIVSIKNRNLKKQRDLLLPRLISGLITIEQ